MRISIADISRFDDILNIYRCARDFMRENGNPNQWGKTNPPAEKTLEDIERSKLYIVTDEEDEAIAVFYFSVENDPTYNIIYDGQWLNTNPYGVIHRIAVSDKARGRGIAKLCFDYAFSQCANIRIDTHKDNIPMQTALKKSGFKKCGIIHLLNGDERIAFQKTEDNNEH